MAREAVHEFRWLPKSFGNSSGPQSCSGIQSPKSHLGIQAARKVVQDTKWPRSHLKIQVVPKLIQEFKWHPKVIQEIRPQKSFRNSSASQDFKRHPKLFRNSSGPQSRPGWFPKILCSNSVFILPVTISLPIHSNFPFILFSY